MSKPHKHAELIKAWADGAEIESRTGIDSDWYDAPNPQWRENREYRIKPSQTDLEKYGVEVGDIWLSESETMHCVTAVSPLSIVNTDLHEVDLKSLKQLVFRRNEINKL